MEQEIILQRNKNRLISNMKTFWSQTDFRTILIKCSILGLLLFCSIFVKEFVIVAFLLSIAFIFCSKDIKAIYYMIFLIPLMNIFIWEKNDIHLIAILVVLFDLFCLIRYINNLIKKEIKINKTFLILTLATIVYFVFPFNLKTIGLSLSFLSGFILLYFVITFAKEINVKDLTYIYFFGMIFSIFIGLFVYISPRLENLCPIFKACDIARFGACYANVNVFAGEIVIAVSLFMILFLKGEIGKLFYVIYTVLFSLCILTISKFSFIVFIITTCLFLLFILLNKKKSLKSRLYSLLTILICSVAISLVLNKQFTAITNRIAEINSESNITATQTPPSTSDTLTSNKLDLGLNLSKFTTGRWDIWKQYLKESCDSVTSILFGNGADAPYVNNEAPHNTIILFIYYFGIAGTLLFLVTYLSLLRKKTVKNIDVRCILSILPAFAFINYLGFYSCMLSFYLLFAFCNIVQDKKQIDCNLEEKEVRIMENQENKSKSKKIAVLTPTYNRAELISRCYESLTNQTDKNFVWYVIDDGSNDDTKNVINEFINKNKKEKDFKIIYIQKENGGKHTALNKGLKEIKEDYVMILDSDDLLSKETVETILADIPMIDDNQDICGLGYLRVDMNNEIIGVPYTENGIEDTFINQRYNKNTHGDKSEVFKTEILKQFPFPEFTGERFLSESTVWCKMSGKYRMKFFNKKLYICDYQPNGLSDGVHKRLFNNPKGAVACYKEMSSKSFKLSLRIKYTIAFIVYALAAGMSLKEMKEYHKSNKTLINVLYLPSKIYFKKMQKKYSS